jgi:hypothetical protein
MNGSTGADPGDEIVESNGRVVVGMSGELTGNEVRDDEACDAVGSAPAERDAADCDARGDVVTCAPVGRDVLGSATPAGREASGVDATCPSGQLAAGLHGRGAAPT